MKWATQSTEKTWRKRPAKQFLMVTGPNGGTLCLHTEAGSPRRTMDFPLQWQGSPVTTGKAVE